MTILPEAGSLRPDRQVRAELTNYGEDGGPRELRVDLVDTDAMTTLVSLTLDAALSLVAQTLDAVIQARHRGRPRVASQEAGKEPGE